MATALTVKHYEIFGVLSFVKRFCLSAIKGFAYIVGGIGGCVILAALALPVFLIVCFLLKLIGF